MYTVIKIKLKYFFFNTCVNVTLFTKKISSNKQNLRQSMQKNKAEILGANITN